MCFSQLPITPKNDSIKKQTPKKKAPDPTNHLRNIATDDKESSRPVKEYPIRGVVVPREKLPRGAKAATEEVTPPWARHITHRPSLKRMVKMIKIMRLRSLALRIMKKKIMSLKIENPRTRVWIVKRSLRVSRVIS